MEKGGRRKRKAGKRKGKEKKKNGVVSFKLYCTMNPREIMYVLTGLSQILFVNFHEHSFFHPLFHSLSEIFHRCL